MSLPVQDNFAETAVSQPYPKGQNRLCRAEIGSTVPGTQGSENCKGIGIIEITK